MPQVSIIGAGIAGLAAARRLLRRGFDVSMLEQNSLLGGKLGAHQRHEGDDFHEHCYHMHLNWYLIFWNIVDQVGVRGSYFPQPVNAHLRPMSKGQPARLIDTDDVGTIGTTLQNIFSGPALFPRDLYLQLFAARPRCNAGVAARTFAGHQRAGVHELARPHDREAMSV